jgi:Secretion system C-terminal sorting domain
MFKKILISIAIITGLTFYQTTAVAQNIAIVQNFADSEIDSLVSYLNSMGLSNTVFNQDTLTYSSIANYSLLIWDDLGYQSDGINDGTVNIFNQYYLSGKPIYFIGDDLAYSIINLTQPWDSIWTNLIHLSGVNNFSQSYNVSITNTTHPVTNGMYGLVNSFDYSLDIDFATRINKGEIVLGNTVDSDVLLVYEANQKRTVSQNCLVVQAGSEPSVNERKKLFKNAVRWLLYGSVGIKNISSNIPSGYSLSQNYPNPFNPRTIIRFQVSNGFPVGTSGNDKVVLKVYDMMGREVQTLVNESLKPGTYETTFDGSNLSSGTYFYKLITGGFSETKRMMLIK